MAKAVRWQIPFVSLEGTKYRVDIYDEQDGSWSGITTLRAGTRPFVTEENADEDIFFAVRSQTGVLEICTDIEPQTLYPSGGKLSLEEILPENNIARPVRLIRVTSGNPIEWLGFLSCEIYSQDYTEIPQILSLPVISVLEAMKSIYITRDDIEPLSSVGCLIARTMAAIPFNRFSYIYFPINSWDIFNKNINASVFLAKNEIQDRERVIYQLKGISLYDIIELICKFMGWVAREQSGELFFQQPLGDGWYYYTAVSILIADDMVDEDHLIADDSATIDMAGLAWRGDGHQRNVLQGAYSVRVSANLEPFDVNTSVPELPFGDLFVDVYHRIGSYMVYCLASMDDDAYSNLTFNSYAADIQISDSAITVGAYSDSYTDVVINNSIPIAASLSPAYLTYHDRNNEYTNYAGAFLARMQFNIYTDPDNQHQDTRDGLYISLFGGVWQEHTAYTKPIFQMKSVQVFAAYESGYINLAAIVWEFWNDISVDNNVDSQTKLMIDLKIGSKVWTGSQWVEDYQWAEHFFIGFDGNKFESNWNDTMGIDEVDGWLIPVTKDIFGEMVLSIYPETKKRTASTDLWRRTVYGMFFEELSMSFIPMKDIKRTDRSSNEYYKELGTNFRDEIEIGVNLASWLHNSPSPSLLFNQDNTPMQTLEYIDEDENTKDQQPEVELLNRMASYYSEARQRVELEVKHPTTKPIPLLSLNGIGDGKKYLPLIESRDWQKNISTITCFETENE